MIERVETLYCAARHAINVRVDFDTDGQAGIQAETEHPECPDCQAILWELAKAIEEVGGEPSISP